MAAAKKEAKPVPIEVARLKTTADKIRALVALEWEKGDIGRALNIKPPHVYNVAHKRTKTYDPATYGLKVVSP